MLSIPDRDGTRAGRHRPRWDRRILPRRWWRLVVAVLVVAGAAGTGIGLALAGNSSSTRRPPASAAGQPGGVATPGVPGGARPSTAPAGSAADPTAVSGGRPAPGAAPGAAGGTGGGTGGDAGGAAAPATAGTGIASGTAAPPSTGASDRPSVGAGGLTAPASVSAQPPPSATSSPVHPGGKGGLGLSGTALDLGSVNSSGTFDITNAAAAAAPVTISASASWLSVSPRGQNVPAGGRTTVTVALDRAAAPTGPVSATVTVTTTASGVATAVGRVTVSASVGGPATVSSVTASPAALTPAACGSAASASTTLTVVVSSSVGVLSVDADATLPDGAAAHTSLTMASGSGDSTTWTGAIGPVTRGGELRYTISVTDLNNRVTTTAARLLSVASCPS